MRRKGKLLRILKDTAGASMMFVLAAMLLLLSLGVSALAAASAAAGSNTDRQLGNQLSLYADSMQRSILYGLQASPTSLDDSLSKQILEKIYTASALDPDAATVTSFTPSSPFISITGAVLEDVTDLSDIFTSIVIDVAMDVNNTPCVKETEVIVGGIVVRPDRRDKRTVGINGTATVTVTAEYRGKSIVSAVTYSLFDGLLTDDGNNPANMGVEDIGKWGFMSHEKLDQRADEGPE